MTVRVQKIHIKRVAHTCDSIRHPRHVPLQSLNTLGRGEAIWVVRKCWVVLGQSFIKRLKRLMKVNYQLSSSIIGGKSGFIWWTLLFAITIPICVNWNPGERCWFHQSRTSDNSGYSLILSTRKFNVSFLESYIPTILDKTCFWESVNGVPSTGDLEIFFIYSKLGILINKYSGCLWFIENQRWVIFSESSNFKASICCSEPLKIPYSSR